MKEAGNFCQKQLYDECVDLIFAATSDLVKTILDKDPNLSLEETKNKLFEINPGFASDEIFLDIFPSMYSIESNAIKLTKQKIIQKQQKQLYDECVDLTFAATSDLIKTILDKDPNLSLEETKNKLFEMNSGFASDEIFLDIFPSMYSIESNTIKFAKQKN